MFQREFASNYTALDSQQQHTSILLANHNDADAAAAAAGA
jgi:hypothetical protein